MSLIKWTPMSIDPFDEMDRFVNWPTLGNNFAPALDIWQDKENVYAECPLAGIDPELVNVSIENDVLTITGKTEKKSEVEDRDYYRKEIRSGSFHRSVALPAAVNSGAAKASYDKGILTITMPKEEHAKPKTVKVEIKK